MLLSPPSTRIDLNKRVIPSWCKRSWAESVKHLKCLVLLSTIASCSSQREKEASPQPDAAGVLFILGKSEGMSDETFDLLKQACSSAMKSLEPGVYSGVVCFGFGAVTVIPLETGHSASDIDVRLREVKVNCGAGLALALARAQQMFAAQESAVPLKKKLVLLLSGGSPTQGDHKKALGRLVGAGATVSTVLQDTKGQDVPDVVSFYEISKLGNGNAYVASSAKDCSRILIEETRRVLGR